MEGLEIKKKVPIRKQRSFIKTLAVCIFFGMFGFHRFYTGYKFIGFVQLFTLGGALVWWLIDILSMCFNRYRDKYGEELDEYNVAIASIVLSSVAIVLKAIAIMAMPNFVEL